MTRPRASTGNQVLLIAEVIKRERTSMEAGRAPSLEELLQA